MPKGYWVSSHQRTPDQAKYEAYRVIAKPAVEAAGGKFLIVDGNPEVREFGKRFRTVVIEFPTKEAAVRAYESGAYQRALVAVGDGYERDFRIVEGVD
jgi:uncharacterized protein (DUF1330 family)